MAAGRVGVWLQEVEGVMLQEVEGVGLQSTSLPCREKRTLEGIPCECLLGSIFYALGSSISGR